MSKESGGDEAADRLARWMSGSDKKPPSREAERDLAAALPIAQPREADHACDLVQATLADYAELAGTADVKMPEVAEHLRGCAACREDLELLRAALSPHDRWAQVAAAIGADEAGGILVAIANAWHWLTPGPGARPVRLRAEDYVLNRRLGGWTLLPRRPEVLSLSGRWASLGALALTREFARDAHLNVNVMPEHLATAHRFMWRMQFELGAGSSVDRIQLDLRDAANRSFGMRTLRPGKAIEYPVDPPVDANYSVTVTWCDRTGRENECAMTLPLRAKGASDNA